MNGCLEKKELFHSWQQHLNLIVSCTVLITISNPNLLIILCTSHKTHCILVLYLLSLTSKITVEHFDNKLHLRIMQLYKLEESKYLIVNSP